MRASHTRPPSLHPSVPNSLTTNNYVVPRLGTLSSPVPGDRPKTRESSQLNNDTSSLRMH